MARVFQRARKELLGEAKGSRAFVFVPKITNARTGVCYGPQKWKI